MHDLGSQGARLLLVHHVAKKLGVARRTVRHLAATGRLAATKQGPKIWIFSRPDIEAYMSKNGGLDVDPT